MLFYSITSVISSFLIDILVNNGRLGSALTALLVPVLPVFYLRIHGHFHRRIKNDRHRFVSTTTAFLIAGFMRGVVIHLLGFVIPGTNQSLFDNVVPLSVPLLLALVMGAVVAYRQNQHLALVTKLTSERDRLIDLSKSFEMKLQGSQIELVKQVREVLAPAIQDVKIKIGSIEKGSDTRTTDAVDALSILVSEVVRPLSHRLAETSREQISIDKSIENESYAKKHIKTEVDTSSLLNMRCVAVLEIFETFVLGPLMRVESAPIIGDVINTLLTYFVAVVLVRNTPDRFKKLLPIRAVILWIIYFLISLLMVRSLTQIALPFLFENEYFAAHMGFRFVFVLGFVIVGIIHQQDSTADIELKSTVEQLDLLVSRLRREVAAQRKSLSWVLHGPVQSVLISTAQEITKVQDRSLSLTDLAKRMEDVVANIGSHHSTEPNLEMLLSEMKDVWGHSIRFENSVSKLGYKQLNGDLSLAAGAVEFVREGVANAYRHAQATNIKISVSVQSDNLLVIQITNDGAALNAVRNQGLGSSIFDEVCWRWSLESIDDSTQLTGYMPCALRS
jgi:signal transduction histidine kinase